MPYISANQFRLWDYTVSHDQLLIRSAKRGQDADGVNTDIVAVGVFYVRLQTMLDGVSISNAIPAEWENVEAELARPLAETERLYCVECGGVRSLVGAVKIHVEENKLDLLESSLERAGPSGNLDAFGTPRWRRVLWTGSEG